jgi:hypothetical protein
VAAMAWEERRQQSRMQESRWVAAEERAESTMGLLCWGADVRSGLWSARSPLPQSWMGCGGLAYSSVPKFQP